MAARYFDNPFADDAPRPLDAEGRRTVLKAAAAALKAVKAAAKAHRDVSGGSIYVGLGGAALTYYRLAQQVRRGVTFPHGKYLRKHTPEYALELADGFAADAAALIAPGKRVTFLEGHSGALALAAALAGARGDGAGARAKVQELEAYWASTVSKLPRGECELLYGRAGYLYALLWAEAQLGPGSVSAALLQEVAADILQQGREGAASLGLAQQWGLMYKWHDKAYLGAAHGLCGIVYVLLRCLPAVRAGDADGSNLAALRTTCDALAGAPYSSGNLPSSLGSKEDRLVQWCHGAPGFICAMLAAEEAFGGGSYLAAARKAARVVWHRGLLRKGVGLCHGISGDGYALLALYRATRDEAYLAQAQAFALFAAQRWEELYEAPDRAASLYEGLAGAVCFWLDVLDPDHSSMPGFEL